MGKMVQIRNMPDKMHRTLKSRAALAGMSLSDYLLRELRKSAERITPEELAERVRRRERVVLSTPAAELVREGREERERELLNDRD